MTVAASCDAELHANPRRVRTTRPRPPSCQPGCPVVASSWQPDDYRRTTGWLPVGNRRHLTGNPPATRRQLTGTATGLRLMRPPCVPKTSRGMAHGGLVSCAISCRSVGFGGCWCCGCCGCCGRPSYRPIFAFPVGVRASSSSDIISSAVKTLYMNSDIWSVRLLIC